MVNSFTTMIIFTVAMASGCSGAGFLGGDGKIPSVDLTAGSGSSDIQAGTEHDQASGIGSSTESDGAKTAGENDDFDHDGIANKDDTDDDNDGIVDKDDSDDDNDGIADKDDNDDDNDGVADKDDSDDDGDDDGDDDDGDDDDDDDDGGKDDDDDDKVDLPYDIRLGLGQGPVSPILEAFKEKGQLPDEIVSVTMDGGDWRLTELRAGTPFVVIQEDCNHQGNKDVGRDRVFVTWRANGETETDHLDIRYCDL